MLLGLLALLGFIGVIRVTRVIKVFRVVGLLSLLGLLALLGVNHFSYLMDLLLMNAVIGPCPSKRVRLAGLVGILGDRRGGRVPEGVLVQHV